MEIIGGILGFIAFVFIAVILVSIFSWATKTNIRTRSGDTITPDTFPTIVKASSKGLKKLSKVSIEKINRIKPSVYKNSSKVDSLEKLNNLYNSGGLTKEEFEILKDEIINRGK